jgi:dTMP kinase
MFVTFEGVDGSGKTTQARLLAEQLRSEGRRVVLTREPGGTALGERLREIVLWGRDAVAPWAEAALFAAARAQLVDEVIRPALARGDDVVCERYLDSSLAYQGLARGLGIERVLELNLLATAGLLPDRTFLLEVSVGGAIARGKRERDRIEREGGAFLAEVDRAYREVAGLFPQRVIVVDGTKNPEDIAQEIRGQLRDLP